MDSRGQVGDSQINELTFESGGDGLVSVDQIFDAVGQDRSHASAATYQYLESDGKAEDLIHAARQLTFLKGNDSHDYKYSSAALEDYYAISPELRNRYFAAATYLLPGKNDRDNSLVTRVREALA